MTAFRATLFVALVLLVGIAAFASVPAREAGAHALLPAAERARIREHLLGAERMMRAADVAHLNATQRANRARAIELLREYREAGIFPHNHDFADRRVPVFVDAHGTRCAMAHLIAEMGGEALVRRVAAAANNAYVRDLAADPAFSAWLERNGMTVAEAARVQPWYGPGEQEMDPLGKSIAIGSIAASAAAIGLQALDDPPRDVWRSILGVGIGGLGVAAGSGIIVNDGDRKNAEVYGGLAMGVGAAAVGIGIWNLFDRHEPAAGPAVSDEVERSARVRAGPIVSPRGGAGVAVSVSF